MKKYFGTDGIRGKVNQGVINGEKFFKFGLAAGTYFTNPKKIKPIAVIAKDTRNNSQQLAENMTRCIEYIANISSCQKI